MWKNSRLERTALATADRETTDREPESPRGSASPALPNARLNPLLNPLLAKQLGRWAHIYYTASVDKREAAIEKLVCELEAEEASLAGTDSSSGAREASQQGPAVPRIVGPVLVAQPTEVAPLGPPVVEIPKPERPMSEQPGLEHPTVESRVTEHQHSEPESVRPLWPRPQTVEPAPETVPESWQELLRRTGNAPSSVPLQDRWRMPSVRETELPPESRTDGSYVSRDAVPYAHSFDDLLAKSEQIQMLQPPARSWRRPLIAVVVLAVLGGGLWRIQSRRFNTGAEQARKPQAPALQQPTVPQPPAPPPVVAPPAATASSQQTSPLPAARATTPKAPNMSPGNNSPSFAHGPSPQTPPTADATLPSDLDLEAGMRALQGPQRNSAEAARHLWQSVKNKNSSALIPLAGLYAKGDGVTKDCDQAKILLDAATRQSKSHAQFLRVEMTRADLRSSGCE